MKEKYEVEVCIGEIEYNETFDIIFDDKEKAEQTKKLLEEAANVVYCDINTINKEK